ncbi:MAG: DNA methyltransferase [Flavobacteriaceae bacterium]
MKVKVSSLTHHPKNKEIYTLSSIEELMESISEVGLLQPLIIDSRNQVISGNRRFESIKRLGWDEVDVETMDVKDGEEELLLIHFNKQRVKTNRELLNEYDIIQKYYSKQQGKRNDLTFVPKNKSDKPINRRDTISEELGIGSSTLGKLLFIKKHREDYIDVIDKGIATIQQTYTQVSREIKEKESISHKPKSKPKKKRDWRVYYKSSDDLSELKDGEIQTIFTSPPYWNKRTYLEGGGLGNEPNPHQYVENLSEHLKSCFRVLNRRGSFFLNIGDTFLDGDLQNIPHQVVMKLKEQGWILRNTIIWSKTNPKPSSSKTNLTPSYEFIFHLVKSKDYLYNQTLTELSSKSKPSLPPRHRNIEINNSSSVSPYFPNSNGKNMGDFWNEEIIRTSVANQKLDIEGEHPAPFPEEILILPILQSSNEGDVVLDPFMGSGTTGIVCDELNRRFVGYDLKKY